MQPDTIIPAPFNPQSWNRFSYVINNPINRIDPSGHDDWACETASCSYNYYHHNNYSAKDELAYIKERLIFDYGVTLLDSGAKSPKYKGSHARSWDLENARVVDYGMAEIDAHLNGKTKDITQSVTFTLNTYDGVHFTGCTACGESSLTNVDFYTDSSFPLQNFYHEFGHVMDNSPGNVDRFSNALKSLKSPNFLSGNNINSDALFMERVYGPYNGGNGADALQHRNPGSDRFLENWADIFANYVAGNINTNNDIGRNMNVFVTGQIEGLP